MYYLLTGCFVPVYDKSGANHGPLMGIPVKNKIKHYKKYKLYPKNFTLISLGNNQWVKVVFIEYDLGVLIIKTKGRNSAYQIGNLLKSYLSVFEHVGFPDDRQYFYLQEIEIIPKQSQSWEKLFPRMPFAIDADPQLLSNELHSGPVLLENHLNAVKENIPKLLLDARLAESLDHLVTSYSLFYGNMSGSYYYYHYSRDRKRASKSTMQKKYFENRHKYELAFLAAFKGIERFLKGSDFKSNEVVELIQGLPYGKIKEMRTYTRFHEVFSKQPKITTLDDMVKRFLKLRNVTAAHANRNPPIDFLITEDQIIEVQLFLKNMIGMGMDSI